jgi:NAD(P)-dependent dehydrogenase (short-subunit alcohol dehydrogenase family)
MTEWRDQVAVVTGGSRGIGRATARLLASKGAAVCINYISQAEPAEALAREIGAAGGRVATMAADVSDAAQMRSMVERIEAELGRITILVNNAGVISMATLETFDTESFERMRRINVHGVIHATRAVIDGMRRRRYGRIVNVSSVAGIGTALPGSTFYAATKAEVALLTRRFALELGPQGITVNAVAPGFVRTDMTERARRDPDVERRLAERAMMRRIGEPEDIANAIGFLAAPESGWITAQVLTVDGGRMDFIGHS